MKIYIYDITKNDPKLIQKNVSLGLKINNDFLKVAETLSSKSPDKKISASAAMDNSQKISKNVVANSLVTLWAPNASVFDLKFCLYYFQRKTSHQNEGDSKFKFFNFLINSKLNLNV